MNRRESQLPPQDEQFLDGLGFEWEIIKEGSIWVLIHAFPLPEGYTTETVTLAIRIETGYPMASLDMMYLHPPVQRKDGKKIARTDVVQRLDMKDFQRWSRHRDASNVWKSGEDSLETHIYLMEEALLSEIEK